ncbi:MAG: AraC family transcriptional regulator [Hydrococcus sp. Prado102]|jgi:AraC family transcriptional regulator|nr:AraC family transcriptional regulator [Hydrococcus sp. Prado102]
MKALSVPLQDNLKQQSGLIALSSYRSLNGFVIEHFHEPESGQIEENHPSEHLICLSLVPRPIKIVQTQNGRVVDRGIHRKGDIAIAPAGLSKWQWEGEDRYLGLSFSTSFIEKVALEALETNPNRLSLDPKFRVRDPQIQQLGMMLLSEIQNGGLGGGLYVESLANVLAVHLLRNYSSVTSNVAPYSDGLPEYQLAQAIEYINEYLSQDIKLTDLATLLDMSQFHFSRRFKQSMGISPHQYLIGQRVEKAKQLLARSDLSIAEVAIECGFNSQSHLGQWFRQLTGMTPKAYQKQK